MATTTIYCRYGRIVNIGDGQYEWQSRDRSSPVTARLRSLPFMTAVPRPDGISLRFFSQHLPDVSNIAEPRVKPERTSTK